MCVEDRVIWNCPTPCWWSASSSPAASLSIMFQASHWIHHKPSMFTSMCPLLDNTPGHVYSPPIKMFIASRCLLIERKNYSCFVEPFLVSEKSIRQDIQINSESRQAEGSNLRFKQGRSSLREAYENHTISPDFGGAPLHLGTASTRST
jgi:hypothetical protein